MECLKFYQHTANWIPGDKGSNSQQIRSARDLESRQFSRTRRQTVAMFKAAELFCRGIRRVKVSISKSE